MKAKLFVVITALLVLAVVALGLWLRPTVPATAETAPALRPSALSPDLVPAFDRHDSGALAAVSEPPLPALPDTLAPAELSMSAAREQGDARAPAVVRDAPRPAPTAAELADPLSYQHYEQRQHQRLQRAYVKAAEAELPRLDDDIARARAEGLSEELIREGEEKRRRIQSMRDDLQAALPAQP